MRVEEVMTSNVVTVGVGEVFMQLATTMLGAAVSGLPVVEADGSLVGIVTEADLVSKVARDGRRGLLGMLIDTVAVPDYEWRSPKAGSPES